MLPVLLNYVDDEGDEENEEGEYDGMCHAQVRGGETNLWQQAYGPV